MEVCRIKDAMQAKRLWEKVFCEDKGAFTDWFFAEVYDSNRAWGAYVDGQLVSMANVADYRLHIRGAAVRANFIQGVATDPAWEGKGCSTAVLQALLAGLYADGAEIASLNTFIHPFYERLGFATYAFYEKRIAAPGNPPHCDMLAWEDVHGRLIREMLALYGRALAGCHGWAVRSRGDFERLLWDAMQISGCRLLAARGGTGELAAYALVNAAGEAVELIAPDGADGAFPPLPDGQGLCFRDFSRHVEKGPMLRILRPQKLLRLLRLGPGERLIRYSDPLFPEESGALYLYATGSGTRVTKTSVDGGMPLDPAGLARLIMGLCPGDAIFTPRQTALMELY